MINIYLLHFVRLELIFNALTCHSLLGQDLRSCNITNSYDYFLSSTTLLAGGYSQKMEPNIMRPDTMRPDFSITSSS
jgi:hypothetical protein